MGGRIAVDEKITMAKNLVNFGQRTLPWQPILWRKTVTSWHTTPLFVLTFYNGWEYRKADCCVNINDDSSKSGKDLVAHLHGRASAHTAKIRTLPMLREL